MCLGYMHKKFKSIPRIFSEGENTHAANIASWEISYNLFIITFRGMNNVHSMYEDILRSGKNKGRFNVILEQLFLTKYAQEQNKAISLFVKRVKDYGYNKVLVL